MTEDCLFLDVATPKRLFDRVSVSPIQPGSDDGAPVIIWMYPGGYSVGDKTIEGVGDTTLLNASYAINPDGVIFVSINYRVSEVTIICRVITIGAPAKSFP